MKKFLTKLFVLGIVLAPRFVSAELTVTTVPESTNSSPLTVETIVATIQKLACTLTTITGFLMVAAIIMVGLKMIFSQGDSKAFGEAKTQLLYVVIGIAVILGMYTILNTVASVVGGTVQPFECL